MRRFLSFLLAIMLSLLMPWPTLAEERPVLTIGDVRNRSSKRVDGENQLGVWRYLEDLLGVEIQYVYLKPDAYASALASGILPDIVATDNNLATILENGVALNVDPYLEGYVPNFLQGAARLTYDAYKQLGNEGDGFYFSRSESDTMASDSATDSPAPAAIFSVWIITVNWVTHPSTTRTIT